MRSAFRRRAASINRKEVDRDEERRHLEDLHEKGDKSPVRLRTFAGRIIGLPRALG